MYLIKQVYFSCGIIHLSPKKDKILREISEKVLLKKLGLSEHFPRDVLYSRRIALGVGIMKIIKINKENAVYQYRYNEQLIKTPCRYKICREIWSDEIGERLETRKITLKNRNNKMKKFTRNKSIIDWAREYIKNEKVPINKLERINHMRIFKKMYLPCEIVGRKGNKILLEQKEPMKASCFGWKTKFPVVNKPSKKTIDEWNAYVE